MTEPAKILGQPIDTDPVGIFQPTEYAIAAMARKTLLRAGIHSPTAKQVADARESARIEYEAQADYASRNGKVLP